MYSPGSKLIYERDFPTTLTVPWVTISVFEFFLGWADNRVLAGNPFGKVSEGLELVTAAHRGGSTRIYDHSASLEQGLADRAVVEISNVMKNVRELVVLIALDTVPDLQSSDDALNKLILVNRSNENTSSKSWIAYHKVFVL